MWTEEDIRRFAREEIEKALAREAEGVTAILEKCRVRLEWVSLALCKYNREQVGG